MIGDSAEAGDLSAQIPEYFSILRNVPSEFVYLLYLLFLVIHKGRGPFLGQAHMAVHMNNIFLLFIKNSVSKDDLNNRNTCMHTTPRWLNLCFNSLLLTTLHLLFNFHYVCTGCGDMYIYLAIKQTKSNGVKTFYMQILALFFQFLW